ncbi:MAG TPA: PPE domain-containing protein [Mycobacterium sp.]|nr:PPE domain-containing protein [Mycobacterium sp.]HPZ93990.1 PPE domain-containing protein [Mycobacterium sp.]HQE16027.1 PPE domain-containing protein [Mycobacterium sp.]
MPDPAWPSSPPEANYLRLIGPGAAGTATTLASGAAWQALMAANEVAFTTSTVNTTATAVDFEGVGGAASAATCTGLNTALQLLSMWVQGKAPIAAGAVAAYEAAVSAMIPAEVALANRAEQAADVALNPLVLGALTPAIVALDAAYFGEFWPQNASAGAAYGAALAVLVAALAVPPPMSPPGAAATAPANAAAAVAQSVGQAAAGEAMKESAQAVTAVGDAATGPARAVAEGGGMASALMQPMQAAMGAVQPVTGMFQAPMQALQGMASFPQAMAGMLSGSLDRNGLGEGRMPAAVIAGAGSAGAGGGVAVAPGGGAGGAGGLGAAGVPGAGLTNFTRPPASFPAENSGRPTGVKPGLLSSAELRGGGGLSGLGTSPVPAGPVAASGQARGASDKDGVAHARIAVTVAPPPKGLHS